MIPYYKEILPGVVSDYDHDRQLVTLVDVVGEFEYGKLIYSDSDSVFEILSLNNDLFSLMNHFLQQQIQTDLVPHSHY